MSTRTSTRAGLLVGTLVAASAGFSGFAHAHAHPAAAMEAAAPAPRPLHATTGAQPDKPCCAHCKHEKPQGHRKTQGHKACCTASSTSARASQVLHPQESCGEGS